MGKSWQNRIVKFGVKSADQFTPHPKNARLHPEIQRQAVKASIETIGIIAPIIESAYSGYLIDGHERVWDALEQNPPAELPYIVVDFENEAEEDYALTTYDPIGALATYDTQKLDALLREVNSDSPAIQNMLSSLAKDNGLYLNGNALNASPVDIPQQYMILIECDSEQYQAELLERFAEEGLKCRALIS